MTTSKPTALDSARDVTAGSTDTEREEGDRDPVYRTFFIVIIDGGFPLDGGSRLWIDQVDEVLLLGRRVKRAAVREQRDGKAVLSVKLRSQLVSEQHARLRSAAAGWFLEDLDSKNGTSLNGKRVSARARVHPGDIIRVGDVFCTIGRYLLGDDVDPSRDIVDATSAEAMPLPGFPTLIPPLAAQLTEMKAAIVSSGPIALVGETGTGKEVLAKAIHEASRPRGPYVGVSCPGLTPSLVEGQLFGFVKGAYSGAQRDDPGFVRRAQGGTLLLDEIPDLPIEMQAKLLRVIQENEIVPLGTTRSERIDVRFLAATQTSLGTLVSAERFREDLHARLNRDVIELPPLRERKEDLGMLIAEILRRQGVTDDDGLSLAFRSTESLLRYRWPHNVRELVDKVLGARAAAKGGVLRPEVPGAANPVDGSPPLAGTSAHPSKDERERMVALLEKHKGNASAVAREIGRSRTWVYHLLHRFQLLPGPFRRRRK